MSQQDELAIVHGEDDYETCIVRGQSVYLRQGGRTMQALIDAAREEGRKEAFRFAIESNQATVRILQTDKSATTPYTSGAVKALMECMNDWDAILRGDMVPEYRKIS